MERHGMQFIWTQIMACVCACVAMVYMLKQLPHTLTCTWPWPKPTIPTTFAYDTRTLWDGAQIEM